MRGRPPKDNTKDHTLRVRMDKETLAKLDDICKTTGLSRSEAVRRAIEAMSEAYIACSDVLVDYGIPKDFVFHIGE